jgi:TRAP-type C4-dicarboxylate transport system permease small subunit
MFGRILNSLDKAMTWFEEWTLYLAVMVGLISLFINVILRYFFHYALAWSEELIREIIILTTFVGLSTAVKNGSMITIDAVVQLVPRLRKPFSYCSHIAVLIFAVLITKLGYDMALMQARTFQKTIILEIPLVILYCILPLMGVMMFIRTIQILYKNYMEDKTAKREE